MPAWLARVPYQGTRPRISRTSVDPIRAIQPPAAGPPNAVAAMTGAIDTVTIRPFGMRTGSADARIVTPVQKTMPRRISNLETPSVGSTSIWIADLTPNTKLVATNAIALRATSRVI